MVKEGRSLAIATAIFLLAYREVSRGEQLAEREVNVTTSSKDPRKDVELVQVQSQLRALEETIKAVTASSVPLPPDAALAGKLSSIQANLDDVRTRMEKLEAAIMASPAKALEIPLLQRDLESVKAMNVATLQAQKDSTAQIYDLLKWLIGLIGGGSILTIGAQLFFGSRKGKDDAGQP